MQLKLICKKLMDTLNGDKMHVKTVVNLRDKDDAADKNTMLVPQKHNKKGITESERQHLMQSITVRNITGSMFQS